VVEVDVEAVLGEQSGGRDRLLGLALGLDPGPSQPVVELPGAVGVVAVDGGVTGTAVSAVPATAIAVAISLIRVLSAVVWVPPVPLVERVGDQLLGDAGVPGVAGTDRGRADGVGVDEAMPSVYRLNDLVDETAMIADVMPTLSR